MGMALMTCLLAHMATMMVVLVLGRRTSSWVRASVVQTHWTFPTQTTLSLGRTTPIPRAFRSPVLETSMGMVLMTCLLALTKMTTAAFEQARPPDFRFKPR